MKRREEYKIVFMGTTQFAASSLEMLVREGYHIVQVVTVPDKPAGRGLHHKQSEVKKYSLANQLPLLQPDNLTDSTFIDQLMHLQADLFVVVAFRILPEIVWSIPPHGSINLHASLLPNLRGAAPIHHAIIRGLEITGVTTFLLNNSVDGGQVLLQEQIRIHPGETAGELHSRLLLLGKELLVRTVDLIREGKAKPFDQNCLQQPDTIVKASKITREFCKINWNLPSQEVLNLIHGLSPSPGAVATLTHPDKNDQPIKIYRAKSFASGFFCQPGSIILENNRQMLVQTHDGLVELIEIQPQGKKVMYAANFLNGLQPKTGWYFV